MSTLPPRDLAARVLGVPSDEATLELYDRSGAAVRDAIVELLPPGFTWPGKRVLDFGCGPGRALGQLVELASGAELLGSDSHAESVRWCEQHLPGRFFVNTPDPPLPLGDGELDLVIAVAVFTHLVHNWSQWLLELHRVLAPGGLVVATFHSRGLWDNGFAAQHGIPWDEQRTGMHVEFYANSLRDSCGAAVWLSEWWLREHWGRAFEVLELRQTGFAPQGAPGDRGQGVALLRRREVSLTPEDLQRPGDDPREAVAAQRSRDLLLVELRESTVRLQGELAAAMATPRAAPQAASPSPAQPPAGKSRLLPGPVRNLRERLATMARAIGETRAHVLENRDHIDAGREELSALRAEVAALLEVVPSGRSWHEDRDRVLEALRLIYYDEPRLRAQLQRVRASDAYKLAYDEPEPLVSIVMRTYDNHRMLRERSIPSVLAQTYQHFEIVVVGDNAPAEAEEAVRSLGDDRIHYHNLPYRGPYPADPRALWFVAGVPPYNEALRRARGRWVAPLDDDDAFRPTHIEALLELARRDRLELAYGKLLCHLPHEAPATVGEFPPRHGQFGFQGAVFHGELRFFELELADALFQVPDDWGGIERMMRAGTRIGMLDEIVTDYFPASEFTPREYIQHPAR